VAAAVVAGVGWLYTVRAAGLFGVGPPMRGALPLQQLAGGDGQPLGRLLAAWLPAGALAGAALARTTALSRAPRALAIGAVTELLLVAAGAASDATTASQSALGHLGPQLGRAGTWAAVGLMIIGSLLAPPRRN
jgi:hypothetical protein